MSIQTKKRMEKSAKIAGIILFVFLLFFNVRIALNDNNNGDINLLGLKISVFVPTAFASEVPGPDGISSKTSEPYGSDCVAVTICCKSAINPRDCSPAGDCVTLYEGAGCP